MMKKNVKFDGIYESLSEFDRHNAVVFLYDKKTQLRGYIAIHRGGFSKPSFGATRFWDYESEVDALKDALRLSKLMSYKNALAGLPYGGAKTVLIKPKKGQFNKEKLLAEYAKHLERLNGSFITGTDMGIDLSDLKKMLKQTSYLVGFKNNPEKATAMGLFYSLKAVSKYLRGTETLDGMSFAIQGVGKVGSELLNLIYPYASKIFIADTDIEKIKMIKRTYPKVNIVDPLKIHQQKVDIFCPCALPNTLNSKSINDINARAIVGSANNQLESMDVGETLHRLGILYCPDYVVNAGGLIAVVNEYEQKTGVKSKLNERLKLIGKRIGDILEISEKTNKAPGIVADEIAQKILNK